MSLAGWIFYVIFGIIFFFILRYIECKYEIKKSQKIVFSIILLLLVSGFCFRYALLFTSNIFLIFVFMMIVDIIYNCYFIESDFFDKNENNIKYYIILIIIGFIINQEFINNVESIFLTGSELRIIIWLLIIIFLYNFFKTNTFLHEKNNDKDNYVSINNILTNYAKFKYKYYDICNYNNNELSNIIYAIMIYENNKRNSFARKFDYFKFRFNGNVQKLGIMQVESSTFISDIQSIEIVYKKIDKIYKNIAGTKSKPKKNYDLNNVFDNYYNFDNKQVKYIYEIIKKF